MTTLRAALGIQDINPVTLAYIRWIAEQEEARREGYDKYNAYYRGDHQVKITDRMRQFLPSDLDFTDNFCEIIVDAVVERLKITGFSSGREDLSTLAGELWQANRMDLTQIDVHTEAGIKGDSYVLVSWDAEAGRPEITHQMADMVIPRYDPSTRRIVSASKKWVWQPEIGAEKMTRLNLYFPDRVEKYRASGGVWVPYQDPEDTAWPLPWVDRRGQPLGVPVIHLRNRARGEDFGYSDLVNVLPLQDLLNKTLVDLSQILDTTGFAQRYIVNANAPATGWSLVPGAIWSVQSETPENVEVGQFEQADISGILTAIEMLVQHISGRSRTPQHLFHLTGGSPSGESLKVSESGLVEKVKNRQVAYGNAWEDVMFMALRVQSAFGRDLRLTPADRVEAIWADPETRNEKEHLEGLEAKSRMGVPQSQLWREMGYSEDQITQFEAARQEEEARQLTLGAQVLQEFDRGGQGGESERRGDGQD